MKLIIDTDPGIDDAMAYCYAHASPEIDTIALTTIFGNVTIDDATTNSRWLTQFTGASTRVYAGADSPIAMPAHPPSATVHGKHGFGLYEIDRYEGKHETEAACDYLVRMANSHPGELSLCAVGPLTNVALAIEKDPDFVARLHQLIIMGGSLRAGGNVTEFAEANFWHDPHAADAVLKAPGGGKIIVVGLDVTHEVNIGPDSFERIAESSPQVGGFLREIGDFYLDFSEQSRGQRTCSLHDPSAVIACKNPELFTMEKHRLSVITSGERSGGLVIDESNQQRECFVCTQVDAPMVVREYEQVVARNP